MKNLDDAMRRNGVTIYNIQELLKCSIKTVYNKMNGITDFTFSECLRIRNEFFVGYSLEYLFQRDLVQSA